MSTTGGNYGGGYTCAVCGQWVGYGVFHSCGGSRTLGGTSDADQLAQILMALGRLEQALRELKERPS